VPPSRDADRGEIAAVLELYRSGYNTLSTSTVQRAYPGVDLSRLRSTFSDTTEQRLNFDSAPGVQFTSVDRARVISAYRNETRNSTGRRLTSQGQMTIELTKSDAGWIIVAVKYE
jgi:hypothetical protein